MRTTLLAFLTVFLITSGNASEPLDLQLNGGWKRSAAPQPKGDWSWQMWRNERGDLLTLATQSRIWKMTSYGDLDRAMDFAASAYPNWLDNDEFPTEGDEFDNGVSFLKLKTDSIRNPEKDGKPIPTISYVMVNEKRDDPFMAVGSAVCVGGSTYYIQHNSKRPISEWTVIHSLRRVVSHAVTTRND